MDPTVVRRLEGTLGQKLAEHRLARGMSVEETAAQLEWPAQRLEDIEHGRGVFFMDVLSLLDIYGIDPALFEAEARRRLADVRRSTDTAGE